MMIMSTFMPFNTVSKHFALQEQKEDAAYHTSSYDFNHRRLMGGGGEAKCGEDEEPLVSTAVLHEVKK